MNPFRFYPRKLTNVTINVVHTVTLKKEDKYIQLVNQWCGFANVVGGACAEVGHRTWRRVQGRVSQN